MAGFSTKITCKVHLAPKLMILVYLGQLVEKMETVLLNIPSRSPRVTLIQRKNKV